VRIDSVLGPLEGVDATDINQVMLAAYVADSPSTLFRTWEEAHQRFLDLGDVAAAVRCAIWVSMAYFDRGDLARGGGWIGRAQRFLDSCGECVEQGYMLMPAALRAFAEGRFDDSIALAERAIEIGSRFEDRDLVILARHGMGRAMVRAKDVDRGLALFDEVMTAVIAGDTSPYVAGIVYCSVIDACNEIFDCRRAQVWTDALETWLESQPDRMPFRGRCLLNRVGIMQLHGQWPDALDETRRAREQLAVPPPHPLIGEAMYQAGELHRVRGELGEAARAYAEASVAGRDPQPGMALLRLAEGQVDSAAATIRNVVEQTPDPFGRAKILGAFVDIMLAADDIPAARAGAEELTVIASDLDSEYLAAAAGLALGATLLAEGETQAALGQLHRARSGWSKLDVPFELARVRLLMGVIYRELRDDDSATMEIEAARQAFEKLGAATELGRVARLTHTGAPASVGGLSGREVEVLALVATGKTNREIADALVISEKTVARHMSNIFTKLDVSTRSAATAYAIKHDLA
jgi:DNA-binding CsgD family transcriptional regulator